MAKMKVLHEDETDINSPDIWRYTLHSDYRGLPITVKGSQAFTIPAGQVYNEITVNHNLGSNNIYLVNIEYGGFAYQVGASKTYFPLILVPCTFGDDVLQFYAQCIDADNLLIGAQMAGGDTVVSTTNLRANWLITSEPF